MGQLNFKLLKRLQLLLLAVMIPHLASAYDFMVDGVCYKIKSSTAYNPTVEVTYQRTSSPRYSSLSGDIIIAPTVTYNGVTYRVVGITDDAFNGCTNLTSAFISSSVTSIGLRAFSGCTGLNDVILSNKISTISSYTFSGCSSLTSITIPNSVNTINDEAFKNCSSLYSVTIPNSVTAIKYRAFSGCSSLYNIKSFISDPANVTLGSNVFYGIDKTSPMCKLHVPSSSVSKYKSASQWSAFSNIVGDVTDGLSYTINSDGASVTVTKDPNNSPTGMLDIPGSVTISGKSYPVTAIGENAFSNCNSFFGNALIAVTIPSSVTSIGHGAFSSCEDLSWVDLSSSVISIGEFAFQGCSSLTLISIPNSTTTIGNNAFESCSSLTRIDLGSSVTAIGESAFHLCTGLTSLVVPNSITTIGKFAFAECTGMRSMDFGSATAELGNAAFYLCDNLTAVHISDLSAWCRMSFNDGQSNPLYYAHHLYLNGTELTNLVIPNDITTINVNSFYYCTGLTSVTIPNSIISINGGAFSYCTSLTSMTIPNSVISIGNTAFSGCNGLTSVIIPNSVSSIGWGAFWGCTGLTDIFCQIENPSNVTMGESVFTNVPTSNCVLHVPARTANLYSVAAEWNAFTHIVEPEPEYIQASSISLNQIDASLTEGETQQLTATVLPEDATDKTVTWTSSDENIATVDQNGLVTAVAEGSATITATTADGSNISANCALTVNPLVILATSVTLNQTEGSLTEGETLQLTATVLPEDATDKTVTWTSSDENVATVENGLVTAVAAGSATITATTVDGSNLSASCALTVDPLVILATSVTLDQTEASLTAGETLQLTATVLPVDATNKAVTWASSDENVATVVNGVVTAVAEGTATITATTADGSNLSASCALTVNPLVILATSVALDQTEAELTEGETLTLTATVLPDDATDKTVAWSSSDENVATVEDGVVTAVAEGTATITATTADGSNLSASCTLTVNPLVILATSVALNQTEAELTEGETLTLTATVLPDDATDKTVAWSSSDENVATVEDGVVTAVAEGTVTITATTVDGSNLSASCALTVNRLIIPGDANGDNSIDATDYVATANYILGDISEGFDISAIDFDNNGVIDVADLVGVTNMILNANATQPAPQYAGAIGLKEFDLNNHLYVESIAHSGVNTYTVSIALDNQDAFTALQADIYLPEDVALSSNFILSDRKAKDHSITSQVQPDGAIRIFISSPGSKNLRESSGEIVSFQVQGNVPTALEIKRIIASTDQAVGFHLQDFNLQNVITGIDSLFNSSNGTDDTYYNILGVPVENPTPGIYIKKGQKVIVK